MIKRNVRAILFPMSTLGEIGEHETIKRILPMLGSHADLTVGAGDDCAVCHLNGTGSDQVFTTDPIIEGVHFKSLEDPVRVGNKAVGRVLSDIAAMGARPQWMLVNVVAPPELDFHYLKKIYQGMNALGKKFGATIIGGDVAKGPVLELHVFGTGLLPVGSALLRSGANIDDRILVTGPLGDSYSSGHHLDFMPKVDEGIFLRETGLVSSMMDLSDGLATDLRHVLKQSGVGAELRSRCIPAHGTVEQALFDGEDFELLLTSSPENSDQLRLDWNKRFGTELSIIGTITPNSGDLELDGQELATKAFEHFSADKRL